jgi:ribosomal-protein-alanine N-acetyltransferase
MKHIPRTEYIHIKLTRNIDDLKYCASMMSQSEPWITLKRSYEDSLGVLMDPIKEVYIAQANNEIIGFMILMMKGFLVGYIQTICVAPEYRNKGIGAHMMNYAEKRICKESHNIFLCVSSFNKKAQRFYKRLNYKKIGELKDYIVAGHSEYLLRKTITPNKDFQHKKSKQ